MRYIPIIPLLTSPSPVQVARQFCTSLPPTCPTCRTQLLQSGTASTPSNRGNLRKFNPHLTGARPQQLATALRCHRSNLCMKVWSTAGGGTMVAAWKPASSQPFITRHRHPGPHISHCTIRQLAWPPTPRCSVLRGGARSEASYFTRKRAS